MEENKDSRENKSAADKIRITLTRDEAANLQYLTQTSHNTGDVEWDTIMKSINKKLTKKLY